MPPTPTGERRVSPTKLCPEGKATVGFPWCGADGSELFHEIVVDVAWSCVSLRQKGTII